MNSGTIDVSLLTATINTDVYLEIIFHIAIYDVSVITTFTYDINSDVNANATIILVLIYLLPVSYNHFDAIPIHL